MSSEGQPMDSARTAAYRVSPSSQLSKPTVLQCLLGVFSGLRCCFCVCLGFVWFLLWFLVLFMVLVSVCYICDCLVFALCLFGFCCGVFAMVCLLFLVFGRMIFWGCSEYLLREWCLATLLLLVYFKRLKAWMFTRPGFFDVLITNQKKT